MNKLLRALVLPLLVSLAAGCDAEADEAADDAVDDAVGFCTLENSLVPNSLVPNSLVPNSLIPSALAAGALTPAALAALQAPTADGAAARQLLKYTVSCALDPTQSFELTWTDSEGQVREEVYPGQLGIAPEWATSPLTSDSQQRLVSACLAARVNWYGVSVYISVRSTKKPFKISTLSPELSAYPHIEGAFWGNLFAATPYLNACYQPANVAVARAAGRDCAVGHLDGGGQTVPCGIIEIVGPCSDWCSGPTGLGRAYASCTDGPGAQASLTTTAVVTTALP